MTVAKRKQSSSPYRLRTVLNIGRVAVILIPVGDWRTGRMVRTARGSKGTDRNPRYLSGFVFSFHSYEYTDVPLRNDFGSSLVKVFSCVHVGCCCHKQ